MKIKGAIFDMDGTLVDSLSFWGYLWSEIGKKYFDNEDFLPDPEIDRMARTMIYDDAMIYFKNYYSIPCSDNDFVDFAKSGIADFYKNEAKLKLGARELLDNLKARKIKLCLASATERDSLVPALEACGIKEYFDIILSCSDFGVGKDKPDIYLEAEKALGIDKKELCVIEDSCVALETAKSAGFHTVGVFDKYNFGHDRLRAASEIYLDDGVSLETLINKFEC